MSGTDLSRDDYTLLIVDIQKSIRSIYFVPVVFSITLLVDVFSPVV